MISELKVNGWGNPEGIDRCMPVFSWQRDSETQFTVQISSDPDFAHIQLMRDTRNPYLAYDGFPLEEGQTYYWRVRSGMGPWAGGRFCTAKR